MAKSDTTDVIVEDAQPGFEPEPVPDNLGDIELTGLKPDEESTDSEQVETEQEETTEEQPEEGKTTSDDDDADSTSDEEQPTNTETKEAEPEQPLDPKEQARQMYEQRQAKRNFVDEQRQAIRQYQESNDMNDVEERMKVLEAQQYVDTVERNRRDAINDYTRATSEIPFFKQETPQSQAILNKAIQQFNDAYAVTDPETGEYLGAQDRNGNTVSLFNYLATEAAEFERALGTVQQEAQRTAQKAEAKMRAKAVNPSNPGKVTSSGDELDDLLDKIGDVPLN